MANKSKRKQSKILDKNDGDSSYTKPLLSSHLNIIFAFALFALAFILYTNTLGHDYAQDDAIVIYDNMYTTQGVKGIGGLLKYDTFFGFFKEEGKAALVSGGRYRPLTPIMFAVEWQIFGRNPFIGHLINVLLYGLLGILIFITVDRLLQNFENHTLIALVTAVLFIVHPIHTEVVANIKGRDEIVSMLGSVAALFFILKSIDLKKSIYAAVGSICLFLALLSKENAITFLGVIPLSLYFFRAKSFGEAAKLTIPVFISAILFISIRTWVLGFDFGGAPSELMNNPYIKIEGGRYLPFSAAEKYATIFFTLGIYIKLLFLPHPLTHDYYPRHIDMMQFSDPEVLLSILMYLLLIGFAVLGWKKRSVISYSIIFFVMTLSIVSNIVFPIGTNMSERFLFMPSLAFALGAAYGVSVLMEKFQKRAVILLLLSIPLVALSAKTILRNKVWKDDYTLFTSDINVSVNSAKLNNAVGGSLSNRFHDEKDLNLKSAKMKEAISRLDKALEIHPNYKNPHLIKGNCYHFLGDYKSAEQSYQAALNLDPGFDDALANQAINYREMGKQYGAEKGDLTSAIKYLKVSYDMNSSDYETVRLLGIAYGNANDQQAAISYFTKALELEPNSADATANLAKAYKNAGDESKAQEFMQKAVNIDPNVFKK